MSADLPTRVGLTGRDSGRRTGYEEDRARSTLGARLSPRSSLENSTPLASVEERSGVGRRASGVPDPLEWQVHRLNRHDLTTFHWSFTTPGPISHNLPYCPRPLYHSFHLDPTRIPLTHPCDRRTRPHIPDRLRRADE